MLNVYIYIHLIKRSAKIETSKNGLSAFFLVPFKRLNIFFY
jgi:hypothetical protein